MQPESPTVPHGPPWSPGPRAGPEGRASPSLPPPSPPTPALSPAEPGAGEEGGPSPECMSECPCVCESGGVCVLHNKELAQWLLRPESGGRGGLGPGPPSTPREPRLTEGPELEPRGAQGGRCQQAMAAPLARSGGLRHPRPRGEAPSALAPAPGVTICHAGGRWLGTPLPSSLRPLGTRLGCPRGQGSLPDSPAWSLPGLCSTGSSHLSSTQAPRQVKAGGDLGPVLPVGSCNGGRAPAGQAGTDPRTELGRGGHPEVQCSLGTASVRRGGWG